MKKMLILLLFSCSILSAQDDFARGVFLFGNINVDFTQMRDSLYLNWVQGVGEEDNGYKYTDILQNSGNLNLMGIMKKHINPKSAAQRMEFEAEQAPDPLKNYFSFKNGSIPLPPGDSVLQSPASAGYMVKEPYPGNQYNYSETTFVASIYLKRGTVPNGQSTNPLVARFEVYAKDVTHNPPTYSYIKSQNFYYNDFASTDIEVKNVAFTRLFHPRIFKPNGMLLGQTATSLWQLADNIDIRLYWYGNVTTWLDKIIIQDSMGVKLFSGQYDTALRNSALEFKNNYPLVKRFYLKDESPISSYLAFNYVQGKTREAYGSDTANGKASGIAAQMNEMSRFAIDAQPHTYLLDWYSITANVPSPAMTDAEATDVGIAPYNNNPVNYDTLLQKVALGGLTYMLGSVSVNAKQRGSNFWYVPQLHGEYMEATGRFETPSKKTARPPTGNEIKLQCNLAIAYGAKGIVSYPYGTDASTWTDPNGWSSPARFIGLVGTQKSADGKFRNHWSNYGTFPSPTGNKSIRVGYKEKWDALADVMKRYKQMSAILSSLSWEGTKTWHNNTTTGTWTGYVSAIDAKCRGISDNPDYVETGHFTYGGDNYIFVVNRRTLNSDSRDITLTIANSGFKWITDVYSNKKWIIASNGTFTDTFAPGEGKLYKISSLTYNWSGDITVMNTVSVSVGTTLTVNPGSTLRFAANQGLTANGKLLANGTLSNPIYFTSLGSKTPGSWGSIILNGTGAHQSKISNAIIKFGTEVRVNYVQTPNYWFVIDSVTLDTMITAIRTFGSNGWVMNSKINYPRDHGVVAENGSTIACYHNKFKKTDFTGAAILYGGGSSDQAWHNDITGFDWGIGAIWGSSPKFGATPNTGVNNRITNCIMGVMSYNSSYPVIGKIWEVSTHGNSIYGNFDFNIYLSENTAYNIYGQKTWYGNNPPDTTKFYRYSIMGFYFDQYLTSDPWNGIPLLKSSSDQNVIASSEDKLEDGIKLRLNGKYVEAKEYFQSLLASEPNNEAAYVELYNTYNDTTSDDIINTFRSFSSNVPPVARLLLSNLNLRIGEIEVAKQANNSLVIQFPDSRISSRAKLNNFYISLYDENNLERAKEILNDVLSKPELSIEIELSLAQHALKTFTPLEIADRKQLRKQSQAAINALPTRFELSQNYPNPFNPSTTISYSIIEPSDVTLTMYDYLGREVETIVNGYRDIGKYSVNFNASNLASGMYFYKIQAGKFTAVKKMLLLR